MVRRLKINKGLSATEIDMYPRIGIVDDKVFVCFHNSTESKFKKKR